MSDLQIPRYTPSEDDLLGQYYFMFRDSFPTYELGYDEAKIKECLRQGKTAREMGYLDDVDYSDEIKY